MRASKMNMIQIHTIPTKKEYVLYLPQYYFKNKNITDERVSKIISSAKQMLTEYIISGKIVCIVITNELKDPSFPSIHPKIGNEKSFKFNPIKIIPIIQ